MPLATPWSTGLVASASLKEDGRHFFLLAFLLALASYARESKGILPVAGEGRRALCAKLHGKLGKAPTC